MPHASEQVELPEIVLGATPINSSVDEHTIFISHDCHMGVSLGGCVFPITLHWVPLPRCTVEHGDIVVQNSCIVPSTTMHVEPIACMSGCKRGPLVYLSSIEHVLKMAQFNIKEPRVIKPS